MSPGTPFPLWDPGPPDEREWENLRREAMESWGELWAIFSKMLDEEMERFAPEGVSPLQLSRSHAMVWQEGAPSEPLTLTPDVLLAAREASYDARVYGTSGELEARGWWMRDVESDQGPEDETQA